MNVKHAFRSLFGKATRQARRSGHRSTTSIRLERLEDRATPALIHLDTSDHVLANTGANEGAPDIAMGPSGQFVAVWQAPDAGGIGIFARQYNADWTPNGAAFPVNVTTALDQSHPSVTYDAAGRFVIAWQSDTGTDTDIMLRRFDAAGVAIDATDVLVNSGATTDPQVDPDLAYDASTGRFGVTWWGGGFLVEDVFAKVYSGINVGGSGAPTAAASQFQVNDPTASLVDQGNPSMIFATNGDVIVAYDSWGQDAAGDFGIYVRRLTFSGTPVTGEILVNTVTAGAQQFPEIASDSTGNAVIVWESDNVDGGGRAIVMQRFDSATAKSGVNTTVNTTNTLNQTNPRVAQASGGDIVVTWQSQEADAVGSDLYFRKFNSAGTELIAETLINSASTNDNNAQANPAVAIKSDGDFVVGIESSNGANFDVVLRRFGEAPVVQFSTASSTAAESTTSRSVTISRSGHANVVALVATSVSATLTGGTASGGGVDFVSAPFPVPLTFVAGDNSESFNVTVVNDTKYEPGTDETILLGIAASSFHTIGGTSARTLNITDDDAPASIQITGGDGQSTNVSTNFGAAMAVTVKNASNQLVEGVTVTFDAPNSGASLSPDPIVVVTNASGAASSGTVTANASGGTYSVSATATGGSSPTVNFTMTNISPFSLTASLLSNVLTVSDVDIDGKANQFTVSQSGNILSISDANEQFQSPPPTGGTLSNGNKTLSFDTSVTTITSIIINGALDSDTATFNLATAQPIPVLFNGGGGTTDAIILNGSGTYANVTHTFTNANDGSVAVTGNGLISYTGLEPITDNLSATDRVFTYNGGAETISLTDAAGATMTIDSTLGESVTFANPIGSLRINGGSGDDTVNVVSLDGGYVGSFTIDTDAGANDVITIAPGMNLSGAGSTLSLSAEQVNLNGGSLTTNSHQTYTGNVVLGAHTSLVSTTGNVTFDATVNSAKTYGVTTPAFNFIDISGTGTAGPNSDDNTITGVPIGFTFDYFNTPSTVISLSPNGWISFAGSNSVDRSPVVLPNATEPLGIVAGWWTDLYPPAGGTVKYQTLGSPGSRTFIAQWTNVGHYSVGAGPSTFQIQLHEGTNLIEVHLPNAATAGSFIHGIGLQNNSATLGANAYLGVAALPPNSAYRFTAESGAYGTLNLSVTSAGSTTFNGVVGGIAPLGKTTITAGSVSNSAAINAGSSNVTITTDSLALGAALSGTGNLTIQPQSAAATIGLGGGSGTLNLSDAELAFLQDGFAKITIGNDSSGNIDVNTATFTDPLMMVTAGTISDAAVGTDINAGSNAVTLRGNVSPGQSPGILTINGNLTLSPSVTTVGPATNAFGSGSQQTSTNFNIFDVLQPADLQGVYVYPGAAGNVVVDLLNSSGGLISQAVVPVTAGDINQRTFIPLNFALTPGADFRLAQGSGSVSMFRNDSGVAYPYTSPLVNITGSSAGAGFYYFFYDWQMTLGGGGNVNMEIEGPTPGTTASSHDQISVTGSIDLINRTLNLSGGYTPAPADVFTIVTATSRTGTFNGLADGATLTFGGKTLEVNYTATAVELLVAPTASTINLAGTSPTNTAGNVSWTVTFSEPVGGVASGNFTLVNTGLGGAPAIGTVTAVSPDGFGRSTTWTVTASTGSGSGTLGLNLTTNAGITDASGATLTGGTITGAVYTIDRTNPGDPVFSSTPTNPSNVSGPTFIWTSVTDSGGSGLAGYQTKLDGGAWSATQVGTSKALAGLSDGSHTFMVQAIDNVGNVSGTPASFTWTVDATPPATLSFVRQTPAGTPTNADTLVFRVTFNEAVTGVDAGDFVVTGTTAGFAVSTVSTTQYDVTLSGGDLAGLNGTVGLNFAGTVTIQDLATNALPNTEPPTDETYVVDNAPAALSALRPIIFGNIVLNVNLLTLPANTNLPWQVIGFEATFSEGVTGVALGTLTGLTATSLTIVSPTVAQFGVGAIPSGLFTVGISAAGIADLAGNTGLTGTLSNTLQNKVGDVTGDGRVTNADLNAIRNIYLNGLPYNPFMDLNGDGIVDREDYNIARSRIGT